MRDRWGSAEEWLLDAHLGQLSEQEHTEFTRALEDDPELATKHERLERILAPLTAWTTPPPPADLDERIVASVVWPSTDGPVELQADLPSGSDAGPPRRSIFSFRELLATAAVIAFFGVILIPSLSSVRAKSQRLTCANNLGAIYQGVSAYSLANRNRLPVAAGLHGPWLQVGASNVRSTPNSRSRFLVLRLRFVKDAKVFVCPSRSGGLVLQVRDPGRLRDFPDPQNCSYDSQNVAGPAPTLTAATALPYMADTNPLFDGGKFNKVIPTTSNSKNHRGGSGQNVLYLDGNVQWRITPNCGQGGDNIWQAGTITEYKGDETQQSPEDAFLVP